MTLIAVVGLAREARIIARPDVEVVIGGGQSDALAARLEAAFSDEITGVLSFGLCGALDLELKAGDLVIASGVAVGGETLAADQKWAAGLGAGMARTRLFAASDTVVATPAAKAMLHAATSAAAVDMESGPAAAFAARHGLPFAAVRAVSDSAAAGLPRAAIAGFRADGGVDVLAVLLALARAPWELPALLRTARDVEAGFRTLRRFAWMAELDSPA